MIYLQKVQVKLNINFKLNQSQQQLQVKILYCLDYKFIMMPNFKNNQSQTHSEINSTRKYHIQDTNNFILYKKFKCFLSQPIKYFILHTVIILSMLWFYIISFISQKSCKQLNYVVIGAHFLTFVFFTMLSLKNPGILLKIKQQYQTNSKINIPFDEQCKPPANQVPKQHIFCIKSHSIRINFCSECLIFKPPRTVHCWTCNACIQNMDHHCSFIGNCVGKGNYNIFICFILSLNILVLLVIVQLLYTIIKQIEQFQSDFFTRSINYFQLILLIFCALVETFIGTLLIYHIYLIVNNLTTNQSCKQTWNTLSGNPFRKAFCAKNVIRFLTGPANQKRNKQQISKQVFQRKNQKNSISMNSESQIIHHHDSLENKKPNKIVYLNFKQSSPKNPSSSPYKKDKSISQNNTFDEKDQQNTSKQIKHSTTGL